MPPVTGKFIFNIFIIYLLEINNIHYMQDAEFNNNYWRGCEIIQKFHDKY